MRFLGFAVATVVFMAAIGPAQAKSLSKKEVEMCRWGGDVAKAAQQSKLAGTTLWRARQHVKAQAFPEPWMARMASGITEQTYASKSRLRPLAVEKAYYDGCIIHERSRSARAKT